MTEPSKEELLNLSDRISGPANGWLPEIGDIKNITFIQREIDVILHALRLAANLPSEEELKTLVFRYTGDHQYPDYSGAAEAILERIRSVK